MKLKNITNLLFSFNRRTRIICFLFMSLIFKNLFYNANFLGYSGRRKRSAGFCIACRYSLRLLTQLYVAIHQVYKSNPILSFYVFYIQYLTINSLILYGHNNHSLYILPFMYSLYSILSKHYG